MKKYFVFVLILVLLPFLANDEPWFNGTDAKNTPDGKAAKAVAVQYLEFCRTARPMPVHSAMIPYMKFVFGPDDNEKYRQLFQMLSFDEKAPDPEEYAAEFIVPIAGYKIVDIRKADAESINIRVKVTRYKENVFMERLFGILDSRQKGSVDSLIEEFENNYAAALKGPVLKDTITLILKKVDNEYKVFINETRSDIMDKEKAKQVKETQQLIAGLVITETTVSDYRARGKIYIEGKVKNKGGEAVSKVFFVQVELLDNAGKPFAANTSQICYNVLEKGETDHFIVDFDAAGAAEWSGRYRVCIKDEDLGVRSDWIEH